MLKNMKVRSKQFLLIIIFTITLVSVVSVSGYTMDSLAKDSESLYQQRLLPAVEFGKYRANNRSIELAVSQSMQMIPEEEATKLTQTVTTLFAENEKFLQDFLSNPTTTEEEKTLLTEITTSYAPYKQTMIDVLNLGNAKKNIEALALWEAKGIQVKDGIAVPGSKLEELEAKLASDTNEQNQQNEKKGLYTSIAVAVILLIISIVVALIITNSITKPLQKIQYLMVKSGEGDLTQTSDYESADELGMLAKAFNITNEQLRHLLLKVGDTASHVAAFSQQLSASATETTRATEHITMTIQDVASGTNRQTNEVGSAKGSLNQIQQSVKEININVSNVAKTAGDAASKSAEGNTAIQTVVTQMGTIDNAIGGLGEVITELGQRSEEIGQIVQVITGIAAQTNLLALNAAIEAARAGEQGKGFAVVADEVRKLAEQSAGSASQISILIAGIQAETDKAVSSMKFATEEVTSGMSTVNIAGASFSQIQQAINDVSVGIQHVSKNVTVITQDTTVLVDAVDHIQQIATQNTESTHNVSAATEEQLASMEEIAASTSTLSDMASELQQEMRRFKL